MLIALVVDGLGAAEVALELAVAYAKERMQFDRPIGSFQAVQHLCADMLQSLELGRAGAYYALWAGGRRPIRPSATAPPPWPRRSRATRSSASAPARSRCSVASASRGSTTSTCSTSACSPCSRRHGTGAEHLDELADLILPPI